MRYAITDETWAVMGPMVERCKSRLGPAPELPDRMFFEAVLYWARTGVPWRDLPSDFGDWSAVYNRLRRWIHSGRLEKLFEEMAARPACEGTVRVMIDSTIVRAHQHSAGASKKRAGRRPRRSGGPGAARRRRSSPSSTRTG
jgi:putative transposase